MYAACSDYVVFVFTDSCRDVPQYKVMIYHVFGIISSSLLSELQGMIPEGDHNDVYICSWYRNCAYVSYVLSWRHC